MSQGVPWHEPLCRTFPLCWWCCACALTAWTLYCAHAPSVVRLASHSRAGGEHRLRWRSYKWHSLSKPLPFYTLLGLNILATLSARPGPCQVSCIELLRYRGRLEVKLVAPSWTKEEELEWPQVQHWQIHPRAPPLIILLRYVLLNLDSSFDQEGLTNLASQWQGHAADVILSGFF